MNINVNPIIPNKRYLDKDGNGIPSVTEILSAMLHEDYLMKWANNIGLNGESYSYSIDKSSYIGTVVHESIEQLLNLGRVSLKELNLDYDVFSKVCSCISGFMKWYKEIKTNHEVRIVGTENKLYEKYYAGTYDLLLMIDNQYVLVDFKTSNHIGYKYAIQASVYRNMLQKEKDIIIDRCIILKLDKNNNSYKEFTISSNKYMNECVITFEKLVEGYYYRLYIEQQFKNNIN